MNNKKPPQEPRFETAMRIVGILIWAALVVVIFLHRDRISAEAILEWTPENLW